MAKFKSNSKLAEVLDKQTSSEQMKAAAKIPEYDTKNIQGFNAYSIDDVKRLISMLNTCKLEPQFYRSESDTMKELQDLVEKLASKDPLFVSQIIRFSRCHEKGAGMRSINQVAAALLVPFLRGTDWGEKFFSIWDKKRNKGGTIFRLDDMLEIQIIYKYLNGGTSIKGNGKALANCMKRAFRTILEKADEYQLKKYEDTTRIMSKLTHPNPEKAFAKSIVDGTEYATFDAICKGLKVQVKTHESMQSEAGQIVAQAVKEGKISKAQAEVTLREAKAANWKELLDEGKLGILAALRNLHNMLLTKDSNIVDKVCKLVSNTNLLKAGKIMPYQIDFAYEVLKNDSEVNFGSDYRKICNALEQGIEGCVCNLQEQLPGRNLIFYDKSGSMGGYWSSGHVMIEGKQSTTSCAQKAALLAAMLAKGTNADVIKFGDRPVKVSYSLKSSVFDLAKQFEDASDGCTDLSRAFDLLIKEKRVYDRIFIISDNECNRGSNREAYKSYVRNVCDPYIYMIDMASYGTAPIMSDKVRMLFGYSTTIFDQVKDVEFNPEAVIDIIRSIEF